MEPARTDRYGTPVRRIVATLFLLAAGCAEGRDCLETCEQVVEDGCVYDGMPTCEALCAGLDAEAEQAGCVEAWGDLEYCMGFDPVCAGESRCAVELEAYNECVAEYCAVSGCSGG